MRRFRFFVPAALCAFFGLVGCRHDDRHDTVNSVEVRPDGHDWIKTDSALTDIASVTRVTQSRADDLLHVQVEVNNKTNKREGIHYQFIWMDAAGMAISTPFPWHDEFLDGGQTLAIQAVAPDPRVTRCRLELKRLVQ
jgi:uncharacterized protein YcfL